MEPTCMGQKVCAQRLLGFKERYSHMEFSEQVQPIKHFLENKCMKSHLAEAPVHISYLGAC